MAQHTQSRRGNRRLGHTAPPLPTRRLSAAQAAPAVTWREILRKIQYYTGPAARPSGSARTRWLGGSRQPPALVTLKHKQTLTHTLPTHTQTHIQTRIPGTGPRLSRGGEARQSGPGRAEPSRAGPGQARPGRSQLVQWSAALSAAATSRTMGASWVRPALLQRSSKHWHELMTTSEFLEPEHVLESLA